MAQTKGRLGAGIKAGFFNAFTLTHPPDARAGIATSPAGEVVDVEHVVDAAAEPVAAFTAQLPGPVGLV